MPFFTNSYECGRCGACWTETCDCPCDDRCPACNHTTSPYESDEIETDEFGLAPSDWDFINAQYAPGLGGAA